MGEFEDFFEDDELVSEASENKKKEPKQSSTVKQQDIHENNSDTSSLKGEEDMAPGMIDLEAIEGTGGYSFDDEEVVSEPPVNQSLELNTEYSHGGFEEDLSDEISEETSTLNQEDQISQNSHFKSPSESEEQETKTFNHPEHDEENFEPEPVPLQEQMDEKSSFIKQAFKLTDEEKKKKISSALEKSSYSLLNDDAAKTQNTTQEDQLFVNLDENELFSDIQVEAEDPTIDIEEEPEEEGIDFGADHQATEMSEADDASKVSENADGKAEDFDIFESFLKEGSESSVEDDNLLDPNLNEATVKKKPKFVLPAWMTKALMIKLAKRISLVLVLAGVLVGGLFYRDEIEFMVLNREPYAEPTDEQLQKIAIIMSKAKQQYLYDHVLSQKKALSYLNENLSIDSRHKESLYLKALLQAQMRLDGVSLAKSDKKSEDPLAVLKAFYSDSKEYAVAKAYSLLSKSDLDQSLSQLQALKKKDRNNSDLSMALAEALIKEKKYDQAYQALAMISSGHRRSQFIKALSLNQLDSKRAYDIYMNSIKNMSSYHPKLELLKFKVLLSGESLNQVSIENFESNLGKNLQKYPPALLGLSYEALSEAYLNQQDTEKAVAALKNATQNSSNDAVFFKMAQLQEKIGDDESAKQSYAQAYKLTSKKEKYLIPYLKILQKLKDYKTAISVADDNSEANKDSVEFLYEYALIKKNLFRIDEAIEHLEQAKSLSSETARFDIQIATIYVEKDDYEQAYQLVNSILQKDPSNELALVYKSKILTAYQIFGLAKKSLASIKRPYTQAYLVYQSYANFYLAIGDNASLFALVKTVEASQDLNGYQKDMLTAKALMKKNKVQDALERLKSHQLKYEKDLELNAMIAQLYMVEKDYNSAIEVLEASMKVNRSDFETLYWLGQSLVQVGQLDAGIEKLISASEIQSKVPSVWFELQKAFVIKDNFEKVQYYYQQTIDRNPQYLKSYLTMADYYFKSNLYNKAKPVYLQAIKMAPRSVKAYYNLAVIEKFNRNTDKAKEYFNKVIQLDKNNSPAYLALGILEEEGRNVARAQSLFEKAKKVDSRNPEAYYLLGMSYRQSGRYRKALQHFQQYLNLSPNAKDKEAIEDQIVFLRKNIN